MTVLGGGKGEGSPVDVYVHNDVVAVQSESGEEVPSGAHASLGV